MYKPILLVEDSSFDAEFTLRALRTLALPNRVLLAHDGEEALQVLMRKADSQNLDGRVALVLLDLKLPKIDGFDILKKIKSDPMLKGTAVIVLTGSSLMSDRVRAELLGANCFVSKNEGIHEFAELLRNAISPLRDQLS